MWMKICTNIIFNAKSQLHNIGLNFGALCFTALISGCNPKEREASRIFDGQTGRSLYKADMRWWFESFSKKQEKRKVGVYYARRENQNHWLWKQNTQIISRTSRKVLHYKEIQVIIQLSKLIKLTEKWTTITSVKANKVSGWVGVCVQRNS